MQKMNTQEPTFPYTLGFRIAFSGC